MKMKKRILFLSIGVVGIAAAAALFSGKPSSAEPRRPVPSITVNLVSPESSRFARAIAATGTVSARDELIIGSDAVGVTAPAGIARSIYGTDLAPWGLPVFLSMFILSVIFGLALASQLAPSYGNVLVVAAEKMSALIEAHPLDQNTAILFGDGAGAALVSSREPGMA